MDALVAVSREPPRCIGITTAAAALQSGANPFDDSFTKPDSVHGAIIGSLVSFAHSMSSLVPVGGDKAPGDRERTIPKFSTALEMQMMISGSRLVHTGDRCVSRCRGIQRGCCNLPQMKCPLYY